MDHPHEMAVFPWIDLDEPLTICGVECLPRVAAIERAGNIGGNVEAATSYFKACQPRRRTTGLTAAAGRHRAQ